MIKVGIDPHSGFCGGVIRAIGTAEDFLAKGDGRLWSLGAIVHNEEELSRLGRKGLGTVDHDGLQDLGDGDAVLIRAHGEPPQTYERLRAAGRFTRMMVDILRSKLLRKNDYKKNNIERIT